MHLLCVTARRERVGLVHQKQERISFQSFRSRFGLDKRLRDQVTHLTDEPRATYLRIDLQQVNMTPAARFSRKRVADRFRERRLPSPDIALKQYQRHQISFQLTDLKHPVAVV